MRIAMAQINSIVGDLKGNIEKIKKYLEEAEELGADLVAFPEMAVTGYPPQDLLYEKAFVDENKKALEDMISSNDAEIVGVVGFVDFDDARNLYNAAAIFKGDEIVGTVYKTLLHIHDVFDENKYFKSAKEENIRPVKVEIDGKEVSLGVEICEDLWDDEYEIKVTDLLVERGADLIVNISASPFYVGKRLERERLLKKKAAKNKVPIFYVNLVGGQDELVFDGASLAVDALGNLIAFAKQFEEDLVVVDIDLEKEVAPKVNPPPYNREEEMFNALVLGVRDYFRKTGFKKAVVGMSGGIDSSLAACIAVEALGKENIIGVFMPSRFSSEHSRADAERLAKNLGICFVQFSIEDIIESYRRTLEEPLEKIRRYFGISKDRDDPVADENIQPRIRGNCLMDISNRLKDLKILVLNTGNKTELALGYCTLYGDMTGGIGVLGDVSKTDVYRLAEYVNRKAGREIIPENVLKKRPSAELRENQYDPFDYSIVSPLVDEIVENRRSKEELIRMGYPREVVEDVYRRIRRAEYKRRQAPPCIKVTKKTFGIEWKMPIVNKYEG
ncbi:NAD+ synthase [Candidatus Bathyarchaeota archaeon]|nr:NAD+ synthase [Candidatus Bathyarchaeota archaeon]